MSEENELRNKIKKTDKDIILVEKEIQRLLEEKRGLFSAKAELQSRLQEIASEELASQDWERSDHTWSPKVDEKMKSVFKLNSFRPYQLSTINAVMSRQDCILLMPTGGGKSLCFQLPALILKGITLVISPLVSLMEDQIMALESLNIPATMLTSSSAKDHLKYVHNQMTDKNAEMKLLYVTPEKLSKSKSFMTKLQKMYQNGMFSLLAIDEVHCCSQWGHDFRPDYKFLGIMKRQFPNVPILGLTATATSSVISDVQNILNIQGCLILKASFNRPNLKYEVCPKSSNQQENVEELVNILKNRFNGLSGIIYCFSVKDSEEISSELRKRSIKAKAYHAQLDAESRSSIHKRWSTNDIQVIVATVAFGMGIDKPDVRFVIHHSLPKSMENFYQESGRAGRDDQRACCILFYRYADIFRQRTMVFTEKKGLEQLYGIVAYCLDLTRCRRSIIAQHFGEQWEISDCNEMCDHCDKIYTSGEKLKNFAKECKTLYSILDHCTARDERMTSQKLIESWMGKGPPKLRVPNHVATSHPRETCERVIALLLLESYLKEEFHFTPYSTISYINKGSRDFSLKDPKFELLLPMPCKTPKDQSPCRESFGNSSNTTLIKSAKSKSKSAVKSLGNSSNTSLIKSAKSKSKSAVKVTPRKKSKCDGGELFLADEDSEISDLDITTNRKILSKQRLNSSPLFTLSDSD